MSCTFNCMFGCVVMGKTYDLPYADVCKTLFLRFIFMFTYEHAGRIVKSLHGFLQY